MRAAPQGDRANVSAERRFMVVAAASLSTVVVLAVALGAEWGGRRGSLWYDNVVTVGVAAAATAAALHRAYGDRPRRAKWIYLGAALASWTAGEAIWASYELGSVGEVPFPGAADVAYLAAVPLAMVALLKSQAFQVWRRRRVRILLDGFIAVGGVLFVSWAVLLGPLYEHRSPDPFETAVALAYPLGDVVLITLAGAALLRSPAPWRDPLLLVAVGIVGIAVSDAAYAYLTQVRGFRSGGAIDAGWVAGYALIGLAAMRPAPLPSTRAERPVTTKNVVTSYVPVACALAVAASRAVTGQSLDSVLLTIGVFTTGVVIARQVLAISENLDLSRGLERKVAERTAELARERERFGALVQHSSDVTFITDSSGTVRFVSSSLESAVGVTPHDFIGRSLTELVHRDDRTALTEALLMATLSEDQVVRVDWRMKAPSGWRSFEAVVSDRRTNPAIAGVVINARDVSDRRRLEGELRHQAFHDALTGLANRALFIDRLEHALIRSDRSRGAPAVLFVDLDDFKSVNDTAGHVAGDELLRCVARRIIGAVRSGDTVARLGGDEFAILLETIVSPSDPLEVAERIQTAIASPVLLDGRELTPRSTIGLATTDEDGSAAEDLLRHADLAMYLAKKDGKAAIRCYDPAIGEAVQDELAIQAELPAALRRGELIVHYQPLIELASGEVVGMEALVRWEHPTRGIVPPDSFIPAAETSGLIVDIGRHVLATATRQAAQWLVDRPNLELAVNLAPRELMRPDLAAEVAAILVASGFPPQNLVLEITERVVIEDGERVLNCLEELAALGVRLAIDDFGTGYSSLSYLSKLPFHILKIDRSFTNAMGYDARGRAVVETIVRLAADLHLDTVAEGVETTEMADALTDLGCHFAQGYLFAKPMPSHQFTELLRERAAAKVG